jgi:NitT/TauT family transport system ATP-binding protein
MNLEIRQVSKTFRRRNRSVTALDRINLTVAEKEFLCLIGPSGCGKSTILSLLAGLDIPSEGEVLANGMPISGPDPSRVLIFQDAGLFPWLNVQANTEFGLRMKGLSSRECAATAERLLEMVHLEKFSRSWVHELSGGMKQRVALARALAVDPEVLLLDEPFGALDAITRDRLHSDLQELWMRTHKTMVFVTHNVREAAVLGDRVVVMSSHPGRIISEHRIDLPHPRKMEDTRIILLASEILTEMQVS